MNDDFQEKIENKKNKTLIIIAIINSIVSISVALITNSINEKKTIPPLVSCTEQTFICEDVTKEAYFDIEYIKYNIISDPALSNYQVIPFPYISIQKDDVIVYIPLLSQFSHNQYVSDSQGRCVLRRENTTDAIVELLYEKWEPEGFTIGKGCYLAIQYVASNGELDMGIFELRNGQLIDNNPDQAACVIYNTYDEGTYKINMLDWPGNKHIVDLSVVINKFKEG